MLEGVLIAAERFARLGAVIRGLTRALVLPTMLDPDEHVFAVSTGGAGRAGFDIESDRRVACLRLTRGARAGEDRSGLVSDLVRLAGDSVPRRAELYVLGEWAEDALRSEASIGSALGRFPGRPGAFRTHFGDPAVPIAAFLEGPGARVRIIDLGPRLFRIIGRGAPDDPRPQS
ncbi:MAG: hypothetical protein ACR2QA_17555 [Solirubrobacteraceae bacterium]